MQTADGHREAAPVTVGCAGVTFRLYDTATRAVRDFVPVVPGKVSIYHCGLTVQSAPHLGHIRKEVVFDVLRRWLTWSGFDGHGDRQRHRHRRQDLDQVRRGRGALVRPRLPVRARTARRVRGPRLRAADLRAAGHRPRAGDDRDDQGADRRAATPTRPPTDRATSTSTCSPGRRTARCPGRRSTTWSPPRTPTRAASGTRATSRCGRDTSRREPNTASWPTPWGRGRPGWHLECSAMAGKYLGDEFDIHGGGLDLRFPHHENELAQSTAAGQQFARFWMHNAWVTAAGEKMSKSLGNGALVSEVIKRFPARAVRLLSGPAALPLDHRVLRRPRSPSRPPRWPGSTTSSTGPPMLVGDDSRRPSPTPSSPP